MLAIATLVLLAFILVSFKLYRKIFPDSSIDISSFFLFGCATLIFQKEYLAYALEFKPDTISLALALLFILISVNVKYTSIIPNIARTLILLSALLLKQQTVFFAVGIFLATFYLYIKYKQGTYLYICLCIAITGILFLGIIFNSPSICTYTIMANFGRVQRISWPGLLEETIIANIFLQSYT